MKLDFAILADAVSLAGEKLYIHGAPLKRLDVPQLPWAVPLGIGLSFTGSLEEAGNVHELGFRLVGPAEDAHVTTSPPIPLHLPERVRLPSDYERINVLAAIQLGVIGFSFEGWHIVELTLDSEPLASLEFRVTQQPELRERMTYTEATGPDAGES